MNLDHYSTENIYKYLDSVASGQEQAKQALAYIGFMYSARRRINTTIDDKLTFKKSNLLLIGPTGCGKTHLAKALGEYLKLPFIEIDAPTCTPSGFSGTSMAECIVDGIDEYKIENNIKGRVSSAIVFVDEIDKLCFRSSTTRTDDFNMEKQNDILKAVEGKTLYIKNRQDVITGKIDTTNILFIFAGSFAHMERNAKRKSAGFTNKLEVFQKDVQDSLHKDIVSGGLKPELAGRISLVVELNKLNKGDLRAAFCKVNNNLYEQYKTLYNYTNKKVISLSEKEIDEIVDQCLKEETGARGLQTALDNLLFKRNENISLVIPEDEILSYPRDRMKIYNIEFPTKVINTGIS